MTDRILLVDDEQRVLDGYRRTLRKQFDLVTAPGPLVALDLLKNEGPFAVVVSDLQMPKMDGIELLGRIRELSPDTVRMMLTGQADLDASISAVNEGRVFRFLTKPCSSETLASALNAALEQHRLVVAERELLERTLQGTVDALVDVVGLVDPATHAESARIVQLVDRLSATLATGQKWEFRLAASLSQVGTIGLPHDLVDRRRRGTPLQPSELALFEEHPQTAFGLLVKIPRLERVARMILAQERPPAGRPRGVLPDDEDDDDVVAAGAHLLHVAITYDRLLAGGRTASSAVTELRSRPGPPFRTLLIDSLDAAAADTEDYVVKRVRIADLAGGMVLNQDARTRTGLLLLGKGHDLTSDAIERMHRFHKRVGLEEPIEVLAPPT